MISYNPKEWFTFIFRFHKADTFRELLPLIIGVSMYSGLVGWLEIEYFHLEDTHRLKNLSIMHSMLSFVISMLLVFRTNTAYERWWEGRKLWGALVNNSRNLALKLQMMISDIAEREKLSVLIGYYPFVLKYHLKNRSTPESLELFKFVNRADFNSAKHKPNFLASLLFKEMRMLKNKNLITENDMLLMNPELLSFTDICGACERIKNTPIPFSYSVFLKKFIFFFIMTLPLTLVFTLGYYCIPVVAFVLYVLASLELIAEEIEDPFGGDDNDLPLEKISENIKNSVSEIFAVQ